MTKTDTTFAKSTDVDYKLLDKILSGMDCKKMNMMDVVKRVYEATFMYHSLMYYEAKKEEMHMYDKVLEKNQIIDDLEKEVEKLRAEIPEDSEGQTEKDEGDVSLHQGSSLS